MEIGRIDMPQNNDVESDYWNNDSIQFPRLIAEIEATQELNFGELCDAMDLEEDQVAQLFGRAQMAWEAIKESIMVEQG
jgi:hypothetical protein